MYKILIEVT